MDIGAEVEAAKRALSLDLEPFRAALLMEIVLLIACEDYQLIAWGVSDEADGTIRHLRVLLFVRLMALMWQALQVTLKRELHRLSSGIKQASLNVSDLREYVLSARVNLDDVPDLRH